MSDRSGTGGVLDMDAFRQRRARKQSERPSGQPASRLRLSSHAGSLQEQWSGARPDLARFCLGSWRTFILIAVGCGLWAALSASHRVPHLPHTHAGWWTANSIGALFIAALARVLYLALAGRGRPIIAATYLAVGSAAAMTGRSALIHSSKPWHVAAGYWFAFAVLLMLASVLSGAQPRHWTVRALSVTGEVAGLAFVALTAVPSARPPAVVVAGAVLVAILAAVYRFAGSSEDTSAPHSSSP